MASGELEETMAALMRGALAGDEASYAAFLRLAGDAVRRAIGHRLSARSGVATEDVVQETLLALHLKRHTWRTNETILPWMMSIARHKLVDACRRQKVRISVPIDDMIDVLAAPETESQGADARQIERAVETLSEGQKKVVRAIALEGRTIGETARVLDMKETAVRVAFHRGLSSLAARFGRQS